MTAWRKEYKIDARRFMASYYSSLKQYLKQYGWKEIPWLLFCVFIVMPEELIYASGQGLDHSWNIGIALAVQKQMVFGKDFIFTYGPLGLVGIKHALVPKIFWIILFEGFIYSCLAFVLRFALRKSNYSYLTYICIPLFLWMFQDRNLIPMLMPLFIFYLYYSLRSNSWLAFAVTISLAILCFFIKVNYGIVLLGLLHAVLLFALIKRLIKPTESILFLSVLWFGILVLSHIFHVDLISYVQSSLHLIDAYNDAMYTKVPWNDSLFIGAVFIFTGFCITFLVGLKYYLSHPLPLVLYLLCSAYMYLLFKNGFVRADDHRYEFFFASAAPSALLYLWVEMPLKKIYGIFTVLVVVVSFSVSVGSNRYAISHSLKNDYIKDVFSDVTKKKALVLDSDFSDTIPLRYITRIGKASVDIIPWEVSELYRYDLNYNPRPVIQSYSAYDQFLDRKNSEKYSSDTAPEYVLFSLKSIDNRMPFWDESETKRAILTRYQVVDAMEFRSKSSAAEQYFLLQKRETPLLLKKLKEYNRELQVNEKLQVPTSNNLVYLYADFEYTIAGKIQRFLLSPPEILVEVTYDDGEVGIFRVVKPILKTGVLINRRVSNNQEAQKFFLAGGRKNQKIINIRFKNDWGIKPIIKIHIQEMILLTYPQG